MMKDAQRAAHSVPQATKAAGELVLARAGPNSLYVTLLTLCEPANPAFIVCMLASDKAGGHNMGAILIFAYVQENSIRSRQC